MKFLTCRVFTFFLVISLSSCGLFGGDERPVYQGAEYYKNLEVPPDLTQPDTADELVVPSPTDEAIQRFVDNNKLESVVTPKFDGVRMVSYAGSSWIEVDNKIDHVWLQVEKFWESEGVIIEEKRPLLGYMDTEWTVKMRPETSYLGSLLQSFEPDQKDKFRVRFERFDKGNKTRLYISHRQVERVIRGEYGDEYIWVTRPSSLSIERELLSRMALFAGMDDTQRTQLLETYRPYSSLVKIDSTNQVALTMTGSMDFVWKRALRALDRMEMKDIREEPSNKTIHFVVGKLDQDTLGIEEDEDELAKNSWLMNLLTGNDEKRTDSGTVSADIDRQYRLVFTGLDKVVQIEVIDARNTLTSDDDNVIFGTALAEQLRDLLATKLE